MQPAGACGGGTHPLVAQLHHHVDVVAVLEPVQEVEHVDVRVTTLRDGLVDLNLGVQLLQRAKAQRLASGPAPARRVQARGSRCGAHLLLRLGVTNAGASDDLHGLLGTAVQARALVRGSEATLEQETALAVSGRPRCGRLGVLGGSQRQRPRSPAMRDGAHATCPASCRCGRSCRCSCRRSSTAHGCPGGRATSAAERHASQPL